LTASLFPDINKKGDYAFDAGIVTVCFEPEAQEFSAAPLDSQKNIPEDKNTSKGVSRYYLWGMRQFLLQSYSACQSKRARGKG